MHNDVKVCFDEIDTSIKKIEGLLDGLNNEITSTINNVAGDIDAWETKYQKIFDKHLDSETKKFIDGVIANCEKYNKYIKKSMQGYKKIDIYR